MARLITHVGDHRGQRSFAQGERRISLLPAKHLARPIARTDYTMVDRLPHSTTRGNQCGMALNIKNPEVERLAGEVAALAGESKTQAIRRALEERKSRLRVRVVRRDRRAELRRFLESEVWSQVPKHLIGKRLPRSEEERILGFGRDGV